MLRFHKSAAILLPALLLSVAVFGCRGRKPPVVPVSGVVTLDGKPVEKVAVMLMPLQLQAFGLPASAVTDQQGRFTLNTENIGSGAVRGEYQVTVIKKETTGILVGEDGLDAGVAPGGIREKWIIPQKYASPDTSGLKVEVKSGMEPLRLDLQSK